METGIIRASYTARIQAEPIGMSVSVIMPARNAAATIGESICSVLDTALVTELVIVDDKSVDDTAAIAASFNDKRIKVVGGEGRGISAALNVGVETATGEFLARCDADDLYSPDRFLWQEEWLLKNSDFVAISGGVQTITARGHAIVRLACDMPACEITSQLLVGNSVTHFCSWLTRKRALQEIQGAREWFVTAEDLDLMFRLAGAGRVWHQPEVAYQYRLHDASIVHTQTNGLRIFYEQSATQFARQRAEGRADDLMLGLPPQIPKHDQTLPMSAIEQSRGQIIGSAWATYHAGQPNSALKVIISALRFDPWALVIWRALVVILYKIALKSR